MGISQSKSKKDSTTSTSSIPGRKTESKECDPGFIYIPLSCLDPALVPREQADNRPGLKLIDGVPSSAKILKKSSHVILYDNQTRNAAWAFEILNEQTIKGEAERKSTYKIDEDIHENYRTPESKNAYRETDYDRGHLAAADNHRERQDAMDDTNLLSNITPQHKKLNKGTWKTLENRCRKYIKNEGYQNVYVYTGPLYCPESDDKKEFKVKILGEKVVPTHFFKVIIKEKTEGERELKCYKMPNRKITKNKKHYKTDIEVIEKLSGLVFSEKSQGYNTVYGGDNGDDDKKVKTGIKKAKNKRVVNRKSSKQQTGITFGCLGGRQPVKCNRDFYIPVLHQADNRPGLKLIEGEPLFAKILKKSSHFILYDNRTRNAACVFEILNEQTITGESERTSTFKIDKDIHEYYRAPQSENPYSETHYDRGHLAAVDNHSWSQEAMNDTQLLSNITPQHKNLNHRTWKELENHCRRFIKNEGYQNVYVYTGPLYCPESDDEEEYDLKIIGGKVVPTHFFKVIIKEKTEGKRELEFYKMPNRELPEDAELNDYTADLEVIEKLSGLVFSEKSQETESKRVTVHMKAEQENKEIKTEVQIIIPEINIEMSPRV